MMNKTAVINENELKTFLDLLNRLEEAKIHFTLARNQEDAVTVEVAVPGERWEIDCYSDGRMDIEIFRSDGTIRDASVIQELFQRFTN